MECRISTNKNASIADVKENLNMSNYPISTTPFVFSPKVRLETSILTKNELYTKMVFPNPENPTRNSNLIMVLSENPPTLACKGLRL